MTKTMNALATVSTYDELVDRYLQLNSYPWAKVDRRWSKVTLAEKVEELEAKECERARRKAEEAEKRRIEEEMRKARIAQRGSFETFSSSARRQSDNNEWALGRVVGKAVRVLANHEEATVKMTKEFTENPQYAMEWGMVYFEHAAAYHVAKNLKDMFEQGMSVAEITNNALNHLTQGARSPARSSAPAHNIAKQCELAEWTRLYESLTERGL